MTKRALRAPAILLALAAMPACFSGGFDELGPFEAGAAAQTTAQGVADSLMLTGPAWVPAPLAKYANAEVRSVQVTDDVAYCVMDSNAVYAVRVADGTPRWIFNLDRAPDANRAIAVGPNHVGFLSRNHAAVVFKHNGSRVFEADMQFTPSSDAVITSESLYAGAWGGGYRMRSVSLVDGWPGWAFETDDAITAAPVLVGTTSADMAIVFASHDGRVVSIAPRPATGTPPQAGWQFRTTGRNSADLVADDHLVYVASEDGVLYALARESGSPRWKWYGAHEPLTRGPAVAGGTVYQPLHSGIVAIDAATGDEKYRVMNAERFLVRIGKRDFYKLAGSNVGAFDATTGEQLATVQSPLFQILPSNARGAELVFSDGKTLYAIR